VRISPRTFPCLNADGTPFDIAAWLGEEGASKRSHWVTITTKPERGKTGRQIRVQMPAQRISGVALQRELEAAKQRAGKHGHARAFATKQECEWILVATTES
jgi:hypothetical protein